jgi:hypothetical protein
VNHHELLFKLIERLLILSKNGVIGLKNILPIVILVVSLLVLGRIAISAQDPWMRYTAFGTILALPAGALMFLVL